jgi:hypothetical protein
MKNAVFWDIKTQFVPHRRHITSLLQSPAGEFYYDLRYSGGDYVERVLWDVTPRLALVRTDVSEEPITYISRVQRISELGTTLEVTSKGSKLQRNTV